MTLTGKRLFLKRKLSTFRTACIKLQFIKIISHGSILSCYSKTQKDFEKRKKIRRKLFKTVKNSKILWEDTNLGSKVKTGRALYPFSLKRARLITRGKEYQENKSRLYFLALGNLKDYSKSHPT